MQLKDIDTHIKFLTESYELLDMATLRENFDIIELDLGCGKGSFTTQLAQRYPDRAVLACDVMIGRLRKLVKRNQRMEVENMSVIRSEAQLLVSRFLPDKSLNRLHLLCPDPWPKDRHRGNRLMTCDFATHLHRVLVTGGTLHFASDDIPYRDSVEKILTECGLFEREQSLLDDVADIQTDFEKMWIEMGKDVKHFGFRALPLPTPTIGH